MWALCFYFVLGSLNFAGKTKNLSMIRWATMAEQKDKYKNGIDELKEENEKLKFDNVFARKLIEEYKDRIVDGLNYDGYKEKYEELLEKEQLNQQVKQLKARKSQEERKARTKRLIEIGAAVESVLNRPIEHDELPKLIDFLKTQEQRGHFFSKAMNKDSQNYNSNNDDLDFYSSKNY